MLRSPSKLFFQMLCQQNKCLRHWRWGEEGCLPFQGGSELQEDRGCVFLLFIPPKSWHIASYPIGIQ